MQSFELLCKFLLANQSMYSFQAYVLALKIFTGAQSRDRPRPRPPCLADGCGYPPVAVGGRSIPFFRAETNWSAAAAAAGCPTFFLFLLLVFGVLQPIGVLSLSLTFFCPRCYTHTQ